MNIIRIIVGILITFSFSQYSAARIVDHGTYTEIDGLDWLDLSLTTGLSLQNALDENPGWTVATKSQYQSMFANFEIFGDGLYDGEASNETRDSRQFTIHQLAADGIIQNQFSDLFGNTFTHESYLYSWGLYHDNGNIKLGGLYENDTQANTFDSYTSIYGTGYGFSNSNMGTFLVRPSEVTVPEPMVLALMGLGLVGIVGVNRRRGVN